MAYGPGRADQWAIILAGGEGTRLRPLTRRIAGDERPKQFCPLLDGRTLLEWTRRRVRLSVRADRTCLVLMRSHEPFYAPLVGDGPAGSLVVQPEARDTAPAILYGLLRVAETGASDAVTLFPSDHYVSDDAAFMAHVDAAFDAVRARPDLVILLGIEADAPEVQYGWIQPGAAVVDHPSHPVIQVRRFWEKPERPVAERLLREGCLWNSFVLVARVSTLLALIQAAVPALWTAFAAAWSERPLRGEEQAMRRLYAGLHRSTSRRRCWDAAPTVLPCSRCAALPGAIGASRRGCSGRSPAWASAGRTGSGTWSSSRPALPGAETRGA